MNPDLSAGTADVNAPQSGGGDSWLESVNQQWLESSALPGSLRALAEVVSRSLAAPASEVRPSPLREVDIQLARQLMAYEHPADPTTGLLAAMLSMVLGRGQVCLPLDHAPVRDWQSVWPSLSEWQQAMQGNTSVLAVDCTAPSSVDDILPQYGGQPLVAQGLAVQGQVGDETESVHQAVVPRVYLARYFMYQRALEWQLRQRLSAPPAHDIAALRRALAEQFGDTGSASAIDWQAVAAATACLQHVSVITGGPGTGKTTTVTRILSALLTLDSGLRIALAAPTGKAAARMVESIRQARLNGVGHELIPQTGVTLHRLLGWRPDGFRYHSGNPLPYDCVVVDESSMIDMAMMYQLVDAMPTDARLILLGDQDQLASVEAGSVLADLCDAGAEHAVSQEFAQRVYQVCGVELPQIASVAASAPVNTTESSDPQKPLKEESDTEFGQQDLFADTAPAPAVAAPEAVSSLGSSIGSSLGALAVSPMADAVARLRVSHRFDEHSGIGQLAARVNQGQSEAAIAVLRKFEDVQWLELPESVDASDPWLPQVLAGFQTYCDAVRRSDIEAALAATSSFQVLVALRQGPVGHETVNHRIEQALARAGMINRPGNQLWYAGRMVMINRNDYDLNLHNGDVGIAITNADGALRVAFASADGGYRLLLPSRLPSHETSFAMTVHKGQGSEFSRVLLLLPQQWQSVLTRELIYTAITRARQSFCVVGNQDCWRQALAARVERASGLRDALWR